MTVNPSITPRPFHTIAVGLPAGLRDRLSRIVPAGGKTSVYEAFVADGRIAGEVASLYVRYIAPQLEQSLRERVWVWPQKSTIRHNSVDATLFHQWHTDSVFFKHLSDEGITVWIPFDEVGRTAPSLEFETQDGPIIPDLRPGQAIIFGQNTRHRTQLIHGARLSIDLRMAPARNLHYGTESAVYFHTASRDGAVGFRYVASDRSWERFVPVSGATDVLADSENRGPRE